jgi:hypothetical protein
MVRRLLQPAKAFLSDVVPRSIYKPLYKLSHPRSHRHNRRYWPHYRVQRSPLGELERVHFKDRLVVDNTRLEYGRNQACMLVATGPSVNEVDRSFLRRPDIDHVGVNGAIALEDVGFRYYVIIDFNFTSKRFDLVKKVLASRCTLFTVPRCLDLILRNTSAAEIRCDIKLVEPICEGEVERFFGPRVRVDLSLDHFHQHGSFGFSSRIFDAVFDYFTVTYVALQIVHALKYRTIYIAGLDMNNFSTPRFYEDSQNKQPTMLNIYSGVILPAFDAAAAYFRMEKVRVYNLSVGSAVESFEKVSPRLDSLLRVHAAPGGS